MSRFCLFHFLPFLGTLEIREKVSRNRRNEKMCLEMGENIFSHFQTHFAVSPVYRQFFSYFQTKKCLEMRENFFFPISRLFCCFPCFQTPFLLFPDPKVSRNGRKGFFPILRHFLSFLLFPDTFSLISRTKGVQKWE